MAALAAPSDVPVALRHHERFVAVEPLRRTLFGSLCKARDAKTGRAVAIKVSSLALVLRREARDGRRVHEDPLREAAAMRRLAKPASDEHAAHPGRQYVVGLVEAWADAQWHYLATEFVAGGDLFDALERHGAFARDEARRLFAQVALAVDFVHCCGLHHLDLSLENVLLTPEGVARLSDFGAALPAPKDGAPHRLRDDERPAKVLYMSPEVAAGRDFDGRAQDAFALGVLLYELLTSSQPFLQADLADVRFRLIQEGKLARVLERQGLDLQPDAVELLEGLLAADPARRLSVEDALAHRWLVGPQPQPQPEQAKSA